MNSFFRFSSRYRSANIQVHGEPLRYEEGKHDDYVNLILGQYAGVNFPVIFRQAYGKKIQDILDTGMQSRYLISDHMKTILEEHHLTGWTTYPVIIYDKKGNIIPHYHGFSIVGRCDPTDYTKSKIIYRKFDPKGEFWKRFVGIHVDGWDGSDFFIPENSLRICITQKAADILIQNKITNIELENLAEHEGDWPKKVSAS